MINITTKELELYQNILDNQIKSYTHEIEFLNFQKKKIEEHNKRINECYEKISNCYVETGKEVDFLIKIRDGTSIKLKINVNVF